MRAISALLGVAGLFALWHFFAASGLIFICVVITFIACVEFSIMVEKKSFVIRSLFTAITFSFYLLFTFYSQSFIVFIGLFILLVGYFILFTRYPIEVRVNKLTSWTMGAMYCGAFPGVVTLGIIKFGGSYFTALLILSFMTDTFAYLGGRMFGKTPLAPMISPNKTLEGSFVGLVGGSASGFWFLSTLNLQSSTLMLIVVCVTSSLFGQTGDLFESMIKRYSGVKDSGKILPGHGGVLDRIDGLLFAAPVVYLWMQTFS